MHSFVRFEVSDTGIGVPHEKQHLLFQRFSQADASTSRQYGGTGLGLSIVAGLVQSMGGEIGFHSEPGQGSHFWVTASFPLQPDFPEPPAVSLTGKRILVVDDNPEAARALGAPLKFWQAEVEYALDYESAPPNLSGFDLCFVDEALRHSRFAATTPDVPTVLLSPLLSASPDALPNGVAEPPVARITKPVKQAELCACLAAAFGLASPAMQSSAPAAPAADLACRSRHRLLVVEDNFVNQQVAVGLLEQLGYRADVVSEGHAALAALRQTEYTLVLTDCQMPEMDGYELSRRIRGPASGVLNPSITIIALTANSLSADREKCLAAGMDDFLTKPLKPEMLEEMLSRWIATVPLTPAEPPRNAQPPALDFDETDLLERLMGNRDLAKRIARVFLDSMPQQLAALQEAIERCDARTAVFVAHSIRGSAANVGGVPVRELARELEELGEDAILDAAAQSLPQLSAAMQSLAAVIKEFCERAD